MKITLPKSNPIFDYFSLEDLSRTYRKVLERPKPSESVILFQEAACFLCKKRTYHFLGIEFVGVQNRGFTKANYMHPSDFSEDELKDIQVQIKTQGSQGLCYNCLMELKGVNHE